MYCLYVRFRVHVRVRVRVRVLLHIPVHGKSSKNGSCKAYKAMVTDVSCLCRFVCARARVCLHLHLHFVCIFFDVSEARKDGKLVQTVELDVFYNGTSSQLVVYYVF